MMRLTLLLLYALSLLAERPERVLVIGVDGLAVAAFANSEIPNLKALMARGAYTLKARGVTPTVSSPNWASILMGAGPEQHGVLSNEWQRDKHDVEPICTGSEPIFPTIFGVLHAAKPNLKLGAIYDWKDFGRLVEKNALSYDKPVLPSAATAKAAIDYWKREKPDFLFVHFDDVDHAGHGEGWDTAHYKAEVHRIDGLIGGLVAATDIDKTLIIIVSDHGGTGKKHGNNNMNELLIPVILAGPGIKTAELTGFVNNTDIAPTIAAAFKVNPSPCWIGRSLIHW